MTKFHFTGPGPERKAFTLIEILVVLSIITFLMAMAITSVSMMQEYAKESATRSTLQRLGRRLDRRFSAFDIWFNKREDSLLGEIGFTIKSTRSRLLGRKRILKREFPQSWSEIRSRSDITPDKAAEGAEVLYYMLTEMTAFGPGAVNEGEFSTQEIGDTDGDGLLEFVDAWGNPIRFYRWPTRLIRPNGNRTDIKREVAELFFNTLPEGDGDTSGAALFHIEYDPEDPTGSLSGFLKEKAIHTNDTWHAMLLVSAGPDGKTGLYEPGDVDNYGHLARPIDYISSSGKEPMYDNLTSRNSEAD